MFYVFVLAFYLLMLTFLTLDCCLPRLLNDLRAAWRFLWVSITLSLRVWSYVWLLSSFLTASFFVFIFLSSAAVAFFVATALTWLLTCWHDVFHCRLHLWVSCSCICSQCARFSFDSCLCPCACSLAIVCWSQTLTGDGVLCVGRFVSSSAGPASTSVLLLRIWHSVRDSLYLAASAHGTLSAFYIRSQTLTGVGVLCGCRSGRTSCCRLRGLCGLCFLCAST